MNNTRIYTKVSEKEFDYMISVGNNYTNTKDGVVIFLGYSPDINEPICKVCNKEFIRGILPFDSDDVFTIFIETLKIEGYVSNKFIDESTLESILNFLTINKKLLLKFSVENPNIDTIDFLKKLK